MVRVFGSVFFGGHWLFCSPWRLTLYVFNIVNIHSLYWRKVAIYLLPVKVVVQYSEHTFILLSDYGLATTMTKASSESPSAAVERALTMLEIVAHASDGLSNAEISRKLNIPKSSASYILRTLENQGYLARDAESGKYRVGLKILSLSRGALGGLDVRGVALPIMRRLTHQTGLTCHLAVLDGPDAVYIEKVEPEGFIRMDTWVGRRMRVHATSVGKAIVAHIPQEQLEEIVHKNGMEKRTPKTITTMPRLLKDLEKVRAQGYAVDDEENNLGARCVGAPIFDEHGSVLASLGLSGTTQQVSAQTMPRILEALKDAARHISMGMGYRAPQRRVSSA